MFLASKLQIMVTPKYHFRGTKVHMNLFKINKWKNFSNPLIGEQLSRI